MKLLRKPSRPLIRWHSRRLRRPSGRGEEPRNPRRKRELKACHPKALSRRRLGEMPLCHEADNPEGGLSAHARLLPAAKRAKVRSVGYPASRHAGHRILIAAQRHRLKVLHPFRFNAGAKCGPRSQRVRGTKCEVVRTNRENSPDASALSPVCRVLVRMRAGGAPRLLEDAGTYQ